MGTCDLIQMNGQPWTRYGIPLCQIHGSPVSRSGKTQSCGRLRSTRLGSVRRAVSLSHGLPVQVTHKDSDLWTGLFVTHPSLWCHNSALPKNLLSSSCMGCQTTKSLSGSIVITQQSHDYKHEETWISLLERICVYSRSWAGNGPCPYPLMLLSPYYTTPRQGWKQLLDSGMAVGYFEQAWMWHFWPLEKSSTFMQGTL